MASNLILNPQLDPGTFNRIREIVYDISGIALSENKESLVKARISKRMRKLGLDNYKEYLEFILKDDSGVEVQELLDAISTNTTSFYREADHFEFYRKILKEWEQKGQKNFRIWCAAASTGEEPYTLAIETREALYNTGAKVKVLATDINSAVLRMAGNGEYSAEKVELIAKHLRSKYFLRHKHGDTYIYQAKDILKDIIMYRQLNLKHIPFPIRPNVDVIMCRNVMIYFDNILRGKLAQEFARLLKTGGYLIVGHAESLTGMSKNLRCIKPSIYMKE